MDLSDLIFSVNTYETETQLYDETGEPTKTDGWSTRILLRGTFIDVSDSIETIITLWREARV